MELDKTDDVGQAIDNMESCLGVLKDGAPLLRGAESAGNQWLLGREARPHTGQIRSGHSWAFAA